MHGPVDCDGLCIGTVSDLELVLNVLTVVVELSLEGVSVGYWYLSVTVLGPGAILSRAGSNT